MFEQIEKVMQEFEKVHKQRAFLLATMSAFMQKEFEDVEATNFRLTVSQAFVDRVVCGEIKVGDEIEEKVLRDIMEMIKRYMAVEDIKDQIKGGESL